MKKLAAFLILYCSVFSNIVFADDVYRSDKYNVQISYPAGWDVTENAVIAFEPVLVISFSPRENNDPAKLVVTKSLKKEKITPYSKEEMDKVLGNMDAYFYQYMNIDYSVKKDRVATQQGYQALISKTITKNTGSGNLKVFGAVILSKSGGFAHVFCSWSADGFDCEDTFKKIILEAKLF